MFLRWMKKLLLAIYLYMGIFFAMCLLWWMITGDEPSALIMGISAAVGVESVAAGVIRVYENKQSNDFNKEMMQDAKQNQVGAETNIPETMVCGTGGDCHGAGGDLLGDANAGNG